MQKSFKFCIPRLKTPLPVLPYSSYKDLVYGHVIPRINGKLSPLAALQGSTQTNLTHAILKHKDTSCWRVLEQKTKLIVTPFLGSKRKNQILTSKLVMKCFALKTIVSFLHQTVHFDGNFQSFQPSLTRLFTLSELSPPKVRQSTIQYAGSLADGTNELSTNCV